MTGLIVEIRRCLSGVTSETALKVESLPEEAPAWIVKGAESSFAAAIPVSDELVFSEEFSNICLIARRMEIGGEKGNYLLLECYNYSEREPFAPVCEEFLRPESREELVADPAAWSRRWAKMLGNAFRDQKAYPVIGELLVCEQLARKGHMLKWMGSATVPGSHDLHGDKFDVEVKSTIKRYGSIVSISGQHQLKEPDSGKLYLAFLRFEQHHGGCSINSAMKDLGGLNFSGGEEVEFEDSLSKLGFPKGRPNRKDCYTLLEAKVYKVDRDFPRIRDEDFKDKELPPSVVRVTYDVDLSGLDSVLLEDFTAED